MTLSIFFDNHWIAFRIVLEDPISRINQTDKEEDLNFSQGLESVTTEEKNKSLQEDIVQYLRYKETKKFWSNVSENGGKMKNWNLVKQRFHDEKDIFFSKEAKVCYVTQYHFYIF